MTDWVDSSKHMNDFVSQGYSIVPIRDTVGLAKIRSMLVSGLRTAMKGGEALSDEDYLNRFHTFADLARLNDVRVKVHKEISGSIEFRRAVFECVKDYVMDLVGNEVVMQRHVNFVTHLPHDKTQLLYLHTDAWGGCSPYEVILWLPLVNVYGTKSMFICKLAENQKHLLAMEQGPKLDSAADLLEKIRPDIAPVELKFGEALLFSSTLMHGAEENTTDETRFILNVRFKSLFSPYGTKALGETFLPVNYRPATEIGMNYEADFGIVNGA